MQRTTKHSSQQNNPMRSPEDSGLLFAIQEEELPEVLGSSEQLDEPDDSAIIASFTKTQESFLEWILVRATTEMAQVHATAFRKQRKKNSTSQTRHEQHATQTRQLAHQANCHDGNSQSSETPRP
jgi:hypothetical protein